MPLNHLGLTPPWENLECVSILRADEVSPDTSLVGVTQERHRYVCYRSRSYSICAEVA